MGTRERRERERSERERHLLEVARGLIAEGGLLPLQMTRIAEAAEYAVGTLYQHFSSKEDLLLALTTEAVHEHAEMFRRVQAWGASSRERMMAIAVADMIFVRRNPQYFRVAQYVFCEVVWMAASTERREAFLDASTPLSDIVAGIVEDAVRCGDLALQGLNPKEITASIWALTLGTHNLVHAEGVLDDLNVRDPYRLMCRHMQTLLNGFDWKPLVAVDDSQALDALIQRITQELFHDLCAQGC